VKRWTTEMTGNHAHELLICTATAGQLEVVSPLNLRKPQ